MLIESMEGTLAEMALRYAGFRWAIFPCGVRGKRPLTQHGCHDATWDIAQVTEWWRKWPQANIGLACGPANLVALDIDPAKGGAESWAQLVAELDLDTRTWLSHTGGGGRHYLYHLPPGWEVSNSAGKLGPGLDVRSLGGYIIVPPSVHPSGGVYRWDEHAHPGNAYALMLPPALYKQLRRDKAAPVRTPAPVTGATPYGESALQAELYAVTCAVEGTRNDTLNRAAFRLGQLTAAGHLVRAEIEPLLIRAATGTGLSAAEARSVTARALVEGAAHPRPEPPPVRPAADAAPRVLSDPSADPANWLPDYGFPEEDAAGFAEPPAPVATPPGGDAARDGASAKTPDAPENEAPAVGAPAVGAPANGAPGVSATPESATPEAPEAPRPKRPERPQRPPQKQHWTADELLTHHFEEPPWVVPGLIPVGLVILAGRPKIGKSRLSLQVALAHATGGSVLDRPASRGKVLYLALEDRPRRIQQRLKAMNCPAEAAVSFDFEVRPLLKGGITDVERVVAAHQYTLVVIDDLGQAKGPQGKHDDYDDMTHLLGQLQSLAFAYGITVLVVDHHRKPNLFNADPIDDIVGSTAKAGVADAVIGLYREQGKRGAFLKVVGRDVEWQELAVHHDGVTGCWQLDGTRADSELEGRRRDVLDVLEAHTGAGLTCAEIAKSLDARTPNVLRELKVLVEKGIVQERSRPKGKGKEYIKNQASPAEV